MKYHKDIYEAAAPIVGRTVATRATYAPLRDSRNARLFVGHRVDVVRPNGETVNMPASEFDREVKRATPKDVNLLHPDAKVGELREVLLDGWSWFAHVVAVSHESFVVRPLRCVGYNGKLYFDGASVRKVQAVGEAAREDLVRAQSEFDMLLNDLRNATAGMVYSDPAREQLVREHDAKVAAMLAKYPAVKREELEG